LILAMTISSGSHAWDSGTASQLNLCICIELCLNRAASFLREGKARSAWFVRGGKPNHRRCWSVPNISPTSRRLAWFSQFKLEPDWLGYVLSKDSQGTSRRTTGYCRECAVRTILQHQLKFVVVFI
jgi:hypothetical protein